MIHANKARELTEQNRKNNIRRQKIIDCEIKRIHNQITESVNNCHNKCLTSWPYQYNEEIQEILKNNGYKITKDLDKYIIEW